MFRRILLANRGEIAVRVIRACRELGIESVAIYSEADRSALHVRLADFAYACGPAAPRDSYLKSDVVLEIARRSGADAIHPGYGFFAENGDFADQCASAGIAFIGPRGDVLRAMGDKVAARERMSAAGIAVIPGSGPVSDDTAHSAAEQLGYPVVVKATAGGGGRGMRVVEHADDLGQALERVRGEARSAFGNDTLYLEKFVAGPRHIEVQFLADSHGNVVQLGERECSIQRRHQKLIEEAPGNGIGSELRAALGVAALTAVDAMGYCGAGTCEFLLGEDGEFHFLEMNTRIQVEHAVTEAITGIDIVTEMIRCAAGEPLTIRQSEIDAAFRGHAIEARIYAEDGDRGFLPSPGRIDIYRPPGGYGVRVDSGVHVGSQVTSHYDPLIAKVIAWGADRPAAIARLERALGEFAIGGIATSVGFLRRVLRHPAFVTGRYTTEFVPNEMAGGKPDTTTEEHENFVETARLIAALATFADAGVPDRDVEPARFEVREKGGPVVPVSLRTVADGGYAATQHDTTRIFDAVRSDGSGYSIIEAGRQFEASLLAKGNHVEVCFGGRCARIEVRRVASEDA